MSGDKPLDFSAHNEEVHRVWEAYRIGRPSRVPMVIGIGLRFLVSDPEANAGRIGYADYLGDPDVMFESQVRFHDWVRHRVPCDQPMGELAEEESYPVSVDFQTFYEASWLGCSLREVPGDIPDAEPLLGDDDKRMLFDRGIPNPFAGIMGRIREFHDRFQEKVVDFRFKGRRAALATPAFLRTDGPMSLACSLRGATAFCLDLVEDPDYARQLLDFIAEATIERVRAWRRYLGTQEPVTFWGFPDDSIALISAELYRQAVLPVHRRLFECLSSPDAYRWIHLCGDASRHFPCIRDELGVRDFDTGYPLDLASAVRGLGPGIRVNGGIHVEHLRLGSPQEVAEEVRGILESGVKETGGFVLREANNTAPGTPLGNIRAMYEACRLHGGYPESWYIHHQDRPTHLMRAG